MRTLMMITLAAAVAACARPGNGGDGSDDTLGVAPVRPAGATAVPSSTHAATGTWELHREGGMRGPGIRMTLVVDSVVNADAFGRVTHYLAGNAGSEVDPFGPLTGTAAGDTLALASARNGLALEGTVAGDTVRLARLVIGGAEMGGEWMLVRQ